VREIGAAGVCERQRVPRDRVADQCGVVISSDRRAISTSRRRMTRVIPTRVVSVALATADELEEPVRGLLLETLSAIMS
jgi:hypothetical protein